MATLAGLARERLEKLYEAALSKRGGDERRLLLGSIDLFANRQPEWLPPVLAQAQIKAPGGPLRGIRLAPVYLTDGLFEHAFQVYDFRIEPPEPNTLFVYAKDRWPVYVGAVKDEADWPDVGDPRRTEALKMQADELWLCPLGPFLQFDCHLLVDALVRVYRPVINNRMR